MSKNQNAAVRSETQSEPERGLAELRAQVEELASSFATLAAMLLPHHLRASCSCGRLANGTVQATQAGVFDVKSFALCDECTLPEGFREVGRVSLGPAERETVRLANKLSCLQLSRQS
jgi:hypothetical protein